MGGSAFAKDGSDGPALSVPRLNPSQYNMLRQRCRTILLRYFDRVETPIEAPEKSDHGDIDFLVANRPGAVPVSNQALATALRATRRLENGPTVSFAIPWSRTVYELDERDEEAATQEYAQMDVHTCSWDDLPWMNFFRSYGDLWQILGLIIRGSGLVANETGFHVRIPQIESFNKKRGTLFLTSDPEDVMEFLKLDPETFAEGFESLSEVFEWIEECRFFGPHVLNYESRTSNDRQRMRKRAMFRLFLEGWAPAQFPFYDAGSETVSKRDRKTVLQEALEHFDQTASYREMMHAYNVEKKESDFWDWATQALSRDGRNVNDTIRGLKRFVRFPNGRPEICDLAMAENSPKAVWTRVSRLTEVDLKEWVLDHWKEAHAMEKKRAKTREQERRQGDT